MYANEATVENLAWSADRVLSFCEDGLRDKVPEGLVGVLPLEAGGLLNLKLMLDIIMDVDDSALRVLTENFQRLWMKDVAGENVETVVSYLKGALMLLSNCKKIPTDVLGILKDIFFLAECDEFTALMSSVYFENISITNVIDYFEYLTLVEAEYRTICQKRK